MKSCHTVAFPSLQMFSRKNLMEKVVHSLSHTRCSALIPLIEEPVPVSVIDLGGGVFDVVVKPTAGSGPYHVDVGLPQDDDHPNEIGIHLGGAPFDAKIDLGSGRL